METNAILETHLRKLRIPTFLENYAKFASDAVQNNQDHVRYLLALAEVEVSQVEVSQREQNQRARRKARFPVLKELADFYF